MICIGWDTWNHLAVKKISLSLLKILLAECLQIIYPLTSHVYNYLTMCRRIIDVGLNCWCCIAVMLAAISFVSKQVGSGSFGILSTKCLFVNLWFNMCINEVWYCVACRSFYAIKSTKPNLKTFWSFQKTSPFHWNLTKSTFSPISGQIESRTIEKNPKNLCPKTCVKDKTNLTFLGIKWPTEVDMPLNKTQTQNVVYLLCICVFILLFISPEQHLIFKLIVA